MITLINATNRPDNRTSVISQTYQQFLISQEVPYMYLNMEDINGTWLIDQSRGVQKQELMLLLEKYIYQVPKLIIISPEYNGSFPGILKLFIDAMPHKALDGKKIALTGVATGRGGNLRGLDHLTGIFHYLNAHVMPFKLPISSVSALISEGKVNNEFLLNDIQKQINMFINY